MAGDGEERRVCLAQRAARGCRRACESLPDARLRERADDLLDLESQVLVELGGVTRGPRRRCRRRRLCSRASCCHRSSPALERRAARRHRHGRGRGHLARGDPRRGAWAFPTLVALGPAVLSVAPGTAVVLDAVRGVLRDRSGCGASGRGARRGRCRGGTARGAAGAGAAPVRTPPTACASRCSPTSARWPKRAPRCANGAEGCGLLRTEFLFLERQSAPTRGRADAPPMRRSPRRSARGRSPSAPSMPAVTSRSPTCRCRPRTTRRSACAACAPASRTRSCCARSCAPCSRCARAGRAGCCCR